MYVRPSQAMQAIGCCRQTLRRYANDGLIGTLRTVGGHRRYDVGSFRPISARKQEIAGLRQDEEKKTAVYVRVCTKQEIELLQTQKQELKETYPKAVVFEDIGSGLNFERKGLTRLLDGVCQGKFDQVVVAHQDRLESVGVELIEWIIRRTGTPLVILDRTGKSTQQERTQDIMALVQLCAERAKGKRKYTKTHVKGKDRKKQCVQEQNTRGAKGFESTVRPPTSATSSEMPSKSPQAHSETTTLDANMVQRCSENIQLIASVSA